MMTVMNDVNANGDDISMTMMMMTLFVGNPRSGHLLAGSACCSCEKERTTVAWSVLHLAAASRVVVVNILYVLLYMYLYVYMFTHVFVFHKGHLVVPVVCVLC